MSRFVDILRALGRHLLSAVSKGAARVTTGFVDRYQQHTSRLYVERGHLSRGRRERSGREHLAGERAMAAMMRGVGGIGWPASWTQDRARQVLIFRRWIYVGCDRICATVAALPPQLVFVRARGSNRARHRRLKAFYEVRYRKTLHAIKPHEGVEAVPADHPLARLLKKPNAWDHSGGQLWYYLVLFMLLTGNAYLWVVPDRAFGKPLELWVIPSQWVMGPKLGPAGAKYYEIMPYLGGAGHFTIPAEEIVHFAFKNPLNLIDGWAPIQAIAPWIDVSESIDDSRYWTFKNGSQANGALELGPKYDPDDIDIEAIGAKFLARYQGERNAGAPLILPPDVKFNSLTIAAKDMAYEGGFEQLRDAILAALAVPKGIAGITDPGSDRALWGERAVFYEQAILPRLRYIAEVFTATVCRRWDDELRLYWEDPTPPDPQQLNADLNLDYQHGLRSINEGRSQRGLEPFDNPLADEILINPNLVPLSVLQGRFQQESRQAKQQAPSGMPGMPRGAADVPAPAAASAGGAGMGGAQQPDLFPISRQQDQQDNLTQLGQQGAQAEAQDAALDVNDQAWDDDTAAVQKAHVYNERFQSAGSAWRLVRDRGRWVAQSLVLGQGGKEDGRAVRPFDSARKSLRRDSGLRERIELAAQWAERGHSAKQIESGSYQQGRVWVHGLPLVIENARGSMRRGVAGDGRPWAVRLAHHYGYIGRTKAEADGEPVDVFLGPDPESEVVYVVDPFAGDGRFDGPKVMLGFLSAARARRGYLASSERGGKCGPLTALTVPRFKDWLRKRRTGRPPAGQRIQLRHGPAAVKASGKPWDEAKHPRGQEENRGWFAAKNAGSVGAATVAADPFPILPQAAARPAADEDSRRTRVDDAALPVADAALPVADADFPVPSAAHLSPVHRALENEPVTRIKELGRGLNHTYLLDLENGAKGVFKPRSGESSRSLAGVPARTGFRREVAASRVAGVLGMSDLVPATTFRRQGRMGIGSAQAYVPGREAADLDGASRYDGADDAARAALFDYVIGNLDRHQGNWLVKDGKLALIDNGSSLPTAVHDQALFHMDLWHHAVKKNLTLPDVSSWRGKWDRVEEELRACGIEAEAIAQARQRFNNVLSAKSPRFADLPAFALSGLPDEYQHFNMGEIVNKFGRRARGFVGVGEESS